MSKDTELIRVSAEHHEKIRRYAAAASIDDPAANIGSCTERAIDLITSWVIPVSRDDLSCGDVYLYGHSLDGLFPYEIYQREGGKAIIMDGLPMLVHLLDGDFHGPIPIPKTKSTA